MKIIQGVKVIIYVLWKYGGILDLTGYWLVMGKHVVKWYYHVNPRITILNGNILENATVGHFVTEGAAVAA